MLCLSRKRNESIVIEGGIKITVLECRNGKTRLGIEAPGWVHRQEVFERITQTTKEPASDNSTV